MKTNEVRSRFLAFMKTKGHAIIPSVSLVTTDEKGQTNPTLFNTAGMQPLIPYLLGKSHPEGTRLASSQKCLRTNDIDEVGDNTHLTFFEMLGNWSLGDYFKEDAIKWSFEFLTAKDVGLGLDIHRLYVTVFAGNEAVPRDEEAANIWRAIFTEHGLDPEKRIFYLSSKSNWWTAGPDSPAGPSTEMFYDVSGTLISGLTYEEFLKADEEQKIVEIWNDVFMTFEQKDGKVIGQLPKQNVDTGAGLERVVMVVQGKNNIFETDLFADILKTIEEHALVYQERSARIITDHIKAAMFLISDGVIPSNKDRGYILRRLIRRTMVNAQKIGLPFEKLKNIFVFIQQQYNETYNTIQDPSIEIFQDEIKKFEKTLGAGLREFEKGERDAFLLFTTYGFPFEMVKELVTARGEVIDEVDFISKMKDHQEKSRTGAEQKFKGGLAGHGEMEVKYHTATHLLHQALREVLGEHVLQKGSNITIERLRFDFSHPTKMTDEEKKQVEEIINRQIQKDLPVTREEVTFEEAKARGAIGLFEEKYGDKVSIYRIGEGSKRGDNNLYSIEFCGGPHVERLGVLGTFKIQKEEAVSAGVRRIKAVLE